MSDERPAGAGRRLRTAAGAVLGALLVRLLGTTWRVRVEGRDEIAALPPGTGFVIALWHGELLPLVWAHQGRGYAALISTHADGEVIARIVESLGYRPIRGSTSRGGMRALLEAVHELQQGHAVAFTPDGPRGPRRSVAPGAGVAAAKAGAPVVAMGCHVDRAWRTRSWDRFVIPKPFARITVRYAPPVRAPGPQAKDGEGIAGAIGAALLGVCGPEGA